MSKKYTLYKAISGHEIQEKYLVIRESSYNSDMKSKVLIFLCFYFFFQVNHSSARVNPSNQFCKSNKIRLAFYNFGSFYREGKGLDHDIVSELEKRSGCTFIKNVRPRARIWRSIEDGTLDMTVSGIETLERSRFAYFSPYIIQKNHLVVLENYSYLIKSKEDLLNTKLINIGVVRSFKHGLFFDEIVDALSKEKRVISAINSDQLMSMLENERIKATIQLPLFYRDYLSRNKGVASRVKIIDLEPKGSGIVHGLVLSKKNFNENEYKYWTRIISEIKEDGTLLKIVGNYLNQDELQQSLDFAN